jgi:hypothetical protein
MDEFGGYHELGGNDKPDADGEPSLGWTIGQDGAGSFLLGE